MSAKYFFGFEKLDVYIELKKFIKEIYSITSEFPDSEKFGLISQIRRTSISVASNITEGNSRPSSKERVYFSNMAYGSLMEVLCQIDIAYELGYIESVKVEMLRLKVELIAKLINGYKRYQEKHK